MTSFRDTGNYRLHNGGKAPLPFPAEEYDARLAGLRRIMDEHDLTACVFTSMYGVAYYSGFLYCAFGRLASPATATAAGRAG